jgi:hypothetical protein
MIFTKKKRRLFTILIFIGSLVLVASSLIPLFYGF